MPSRETGTLPAASNRSTALAPDKRNHHPNRSKSVAIHGNEKSGKTSKRWVADDLPSTKRTESHAQSKTVQLTASSNVIPASTPAAKRSEAISSADVEGAPEVGENRSGHFNQTNKGSPARMGIKSSAAASHPKSRHQMKAA